MSLRTYGQGEQDPDAPAQAVVSQFSPLQASHVFSFSQVQGLLDTFSKQDVFSLMVEELNGLINKLNLLGREYSQIKDSSRVSVLSSLSRRKNEEHLDILNKKQLFTGRLTDAVVHSYYKHHGIPKYRIQCYEGLSSLVSNQYKETKEEVQQCKEQMKKLESESTRVNSQVAVFLKLLEEENNYQKKQEDQSTKINEKFQKAKKDLDTVLSGLLDESSRQDCKSAMVPLIDAFVNNLESSEDQYVEILACRLKNGAIKCLIKENIIVRHSSNPRMYCLCIEE